MPHNQMGQISSHVQSDGSDIISCFNSGLAKNGEVQ